jgi:hypothetical protein
VPKSASVINRLDDPLEMLNPCPPEVKKERPWTPLPRSPNCASRPWQLPLIFVEQETFPIGSAMLPAWALTAAARGIITSAVVRAVFNIRLFALFT